MINFKLLLKIFLVFSKIDILSFGGGYASIGIVEKEIVEVMKWMSYQEFRTILAIDELTPGPIAINISTFIGNRMCGLLGGIIATLGSILPSIIISLILIKIYSKYKNNKLFKEIINGLKCMALALLTSTLIKLIINSIYIDNKINIIGIFIIVLSTFVIRKYKINPIFIVLGSGLLNLLLSFI